MSATLNNLVTNERFDIPRTCLIGRSTESNVILTDPRASRRHAMIRQHDDGYHFYDLGSFNGTYIGGNRVTTARRLENGDILRIADVEYRFETGISSTQLSEEDALLGSTLPLIQKIPVIVLVSDIMGYTKLSEALLADELAQVIGSWYSDCDQIFNSRGGTIDKFLGDAVLAYWTDVSAATRRTALATAQALHQSCERIEEVHRDLFERTGLTFRAGAALHLGQVATGRVGQGEFTLVGDTVNITVRIESLTRALGKNVLVTSDFLDNWPEGAACCAPQGEHEVKGRIKPVKIFSVETFPE